MAAIRRYLRNLKPNQIKYAQVVHRVENIR